MTKPITISADSSQFGLGAVCMQKGQPVAYASRAFTITQQNYAQIEKEMFAVAFAWEKFRVTRKEVNFTLPIPLVEHTWCQIMMILGKKN